MSAYIDQLVQQFMGTPAEELISRLHQSYASDGFTSQYTSQTVAWESSIQLIKTGLEASGSAGVNVSDWRVLLELPLYRLRRRIDLLIATPQALAVIELKVGEDQFLAADRQQEKKTPWI